MFFSTKSESPRLPDIGYLVVINKVLLKYAIINVVDIDQLQYEFIKTSSVHDIVGYFKDGLEAYETTLFLSKMSESVNDTHKELRQKLKIKPIQFDDVGIDTSGLIPIDDKIIESTPIKMDNFNTKINPIKKLKNLGISNTNPVNPVSSILPTSTNKSNKSNDSNNSNIVTGKLMIFKSSDGEYRFYDSNKQDITDQLPQDIKDSAIKFLNDNTNEDDGGIFG